MSAQPDLEKLSVEEFAARCRQAMIPLGNKVSYFPASPLSEEDLKEYIEEPVAAVPPQLLAALPPFCIALVPYLEKQDGKTRDAVPTSAVCFERPLESHQVASWQTSVEGQVTLLFAIKERQSADYHYHFYRSIANLAADHAGDAFVNRFDGLLREELRSRVHGEVDQEGWRLKQTLMRRQVNLRRETKLFLEYARQAFVDTLTLYLHGICCDIDVEPGPRQLPSHFLRKRLDLLEELFPPPDGYAVFPEEIVPAPA